ncbi:tRNA (adenosine(37)-N6)-threonylcarbamoyltransferase complex transferase subunit TsaD [Candidatus Kaiserbacteria bacterium CG10_big_fil_rev_8_21_14_0_10_45_20]|uniref:tRNA N6-adenosine threonylcarbamoyltransferase n=1 Tax=Candidatus Kaiserbacteria bacterium CG10_big_fil_rev_8_21_14_0_10_45_20 TaxID=1974607 RepID=A0A2H0UFR3_9BACT|nr:MAG: tRNA (adenosine(37)-N6)-threonylcarbamoyltransferase complex transferase subunit TsaD [Candidatus Kaiserbacteria bacterium CG10_big_fil_rev_8_21_14_0_10_45_20]
MKILAIETSCDETAVTVLEAHGDLTNASFTVLGNALYSQASKHAEYGGVYPSLAKREHQKNLPALTTLALKEAGLLVEETQTLSPDSLLKIRDEEFKHSIKEFLATIQKPAIDLIAVTNGPGLEPALWTGINFAEAIGAEWNIPTVGIDHMEGHIVSALLERSENTGYKILNTDFPLLALLISGGHTEFVLMKEWFVYELVGKTKDDAVGEAFDKVARLLGLPYPGGPHIQTYAQKHRDTGVADTISLPRPMIQDDTCDFSFSGLKTSVLYKVKENASLSEDDKEAFARAFEDSARDVIVTKTKRALEKTNAQTFTVGGGVSANKEIRRALEELLDEHFPQTQIAFPHHSLTGDNAVMIGVVAYLRHLHNPQLPDSIHAHGSQSLV